MAPPEKKKFQLSIRFCGPKCSSCCMVFSIWGILMLIVLGILFKVKTVSLFEDTDDSSKTGTNCFIAAGIYAGTLLLSLCQRKLNQNRPAAPAHQYAMDSEA
ncbi:hypothetical protein CAOG_03582 [Capsaspora owczarzaki ATCC 30864]|uniref:Uncharacterized protein n=1 Tax=Capsaspora owczarzaki (strain ATCC 30864) TaxID=595528 RepID=A0A0D2WNH9_CAPO3|nr:hypothetical protein CAOG_03582 [Capsaspora owczarzaki ATCC 30864]KJE92665.1 hypothetical protein CAOG_003582 [Capsaspora owczarzaki ATCC 30864]|eukprot:XP_004363310.1 hypothetical protein CAOG_03582 [Capsaspora owczarzaki ATCC 30864]